MENCGFCFENLLLQGDISSNDFLDVLPINNLKIPYGAASFASRSKNPAASFKTNFDQIKKIKVISFHNTNLTSDALWSFAFKKSGQEVFSTPLQKAFVRNRQLVQVLPQDFECDEVKIFLSDVKNPDGFIALGQGFSGEIFQTRRNFSNNSSENFEKKEQVNLSLSGVEFVNPTYIKRVLTIAHDSLSSSEFFEIGKILKNSAADQNILFIPDPSETPDNLAKTALYGRFEASGFTNPYGIADRHAATFTISERL